MLLVRQADINSIKTQVSLCPNSLDSREHCASLVHRFMNQRSWLNDHPSEYWLLSTLWSWKKNLYFYASMLIPDFPASLRCVLFKVPRCWNHIELNVIHMHFLTCNWIGIWDSGNFWIVHHESQLRIRPLKLFITFFMKQKCWKFLKNSLECIEFFEETAIYLRIQSKR